MMMVAVMVILLSPNKNQGFIHAYAQIGCRARLLLRLSTLAVATNTKELETKTNHRRTVVEITTPGLAAARHVDSVLDSRIESEKLSRTSYERLDL